MKTAKTYWETSSRGDERRLVREFWHNGRLIGFEVVLTDSVSQ
jgi:hypothetical protein